METVCSKHLLSVLYCVLLLLLLMMKGKNITVIICCRFCDLSAVLDPGRPVRTDKPAILDDAIRVLNQLKTEAEELKETNEKLLEEIKSLKVSIFSTTDCSDYYVYFISLFFFETLASYQPHEISLYGAGKIIDFCFTATVRIFVYEIDTSTRTLKSMLDCLCVRSCNSFSLSMTGREK